MSVLSVYLSVCLFLCPVHAVYTLTRYLLICVLTLGTVQPFRNSVQTQTYVMCPDAVRRSLFTSYQIVKTHKLTLKMAETSVDAFA